MNSSTQHHQLNPNAIALCALSRQIAHKGWLPASSGNLSVRNLTDDCLITRVGKDKAELSPQDLVRVDWRDGDIRIQGHASAEAAMHVALYQRDPHIKAILQTHSPQSTVFSRLITADFYDVHGYGMQKALSGIDNHQQPIRLALLDYPQDMALLLSALAAIPALDAQAFLIKGHGLVVWGDSLEQAKRHLEAWEFLLACELERLKVVGLPA